MGKGELNKEARGVEERLRERVVRYSKEMRRLIYFESYGHAVPIETWRGALYRYWGIHLSSFRLIEVLATKEVAERLRKKKERKHVIVGRDCRGNNRVILRSSDMERIAYIYDEEALLKLTGKKNTIPERLLMRLKTLKINWISPKDLVLFLRRNSSRYTEYALLLLHQGEGRVGMKLFEFSENTLTSIFKTLSRLSDRYLVQQYGTQITMVTITSLPFADLYKLFKPSTEPKSIHRNNFFPPTFS